MLRADKSAGVAAHSRPHMEILLAVVSKALLLSSPCSGPHAAKLSHSS